jgi:hypothetical protein
MRGWLVRGGNAGNNGVQCEKKKVKFAPGSSAPGFSNMARAHGDPFPFFFFGGGGAGAVQFQFS